MGYTFEIQYKQGKENTVADALSRFSWSQLLNLTLSQIHHGFYDELKNLWNTDPTLQKIISELQAKPSSHASYSFVNGELQQRGKLVVGNNPSVKLHIFKWLHDSAIGGHSGRDSTLHRIKTLFYWPNMSLEVQNYVRNCSTCQRNKYDQSAKPGLLQPLHVPAGIWESISLDFIEGLPPSSSKHCILVDIDRLSKNAHFLALSHPYTAMDVANVYLNQFYRLHGMPKDITRPNVSQRGLERDISSTWGWLELLDNIPSPDRWEDRCHYKDTGNIPPLYDFRHATYMGRLVASSRMVVQHYVPFCNPQYAIWNHLWPTSSGPPLISLWREHFTYS